MSFTQKNNVASIKLGQKKPTLTHMHKMITIMNHIKVLMSKKGQRWMKIMLQILVFQPHNTVKASEWVLNWHLVTLMCDYSV